MCVSPNVSWMQSRSPDMAIITMYSLLLALLLPLLLLLVLILLKKTKQPARHLPPSPFRLPIIGNLHQLGRLPHRSLHALSLKYGPLMFLKLGQQTSPTLVVSSADMAREIMKTHDVAFSNRPPNPISHKLMYGKDIAFSPYGEYWRQARRICLLHLLGSKQVELFRPVREEETAIGIDKLRAAAAAGKVPINLSEAVVAITKSVASRAALGKEYAVGGGENDAKEIHRLIREFQDLLGMLHVADFFPWLGWIKRLNGADLRVEKHFKEWDDLLTKILKDHESGKRDEGDQISHEDVKDFVDVLLQVQKDGSAGIRFTHDHIKAIVLDMFAAGTGSTFAAVEWTMAELMRNPKAMQKLQEEVRGVVGSQSMVTGDDLHQMKYLKSVIKECLRMHPPIPLVPRQSIEEVKIDGYNIPAHTSVLINAWAIGMDPKFWENPEEFRPERFLSSSSSSGRQVDFRGYDYELIPFGSGRRGCPAIHFAIATIELLLANLVYHFDWEMPEGVSREDLDMNEASGRLTVQKKEALVLVAKPHSVIAN